MKTIWVILFMILFVQLAYSETVTIELTETQHDVLCQYATGNSLTAEEYATNIIGGWINSHINGYYIEEVRKKTPEDLKTMFGEIKIKNGGN